MFANEGTGHLDEIAARNPSYAYQLLTETEAAEFLATTPGVLRTMRCRKVGPPFVRRGRSIRYERLALMRYSAAGTVSFSTAGRAAA